MDAGPSSPPPSSSSAKRVSNLSAFIKKRHLEKYTDCCQISDGENKRGNQTLPGKIPKCKSTDRWCPMPGRDLRLERSPKLSKYRTFHGSPGLKRKQFSRSRSMGAECLSCSTPSLEAPRPETNTDSGPRGGQKNRLHIFFIAVAIPLLAFCLYSFFPLTGNRCLGHKAFNCTASFDFHKLKAELGKRVFGQEAATSVILHTLNLYFEGESVPHQPLVLSLHGSTGVGKTLVARILEEHFLGCNANVQWYFPDSEVLGEWVFRTIDTCLTNVFVLDDMEKNDQGIITQLRDMLIAWPVDTRVEQPTQTVFVITTNAGSKRIDEIVVSELKQDRSRQEIPLNSFSAPNEFLTIPNLKFVPFLPLDRSIVLLCAKHFVASYNYYGPNYSESLLDNLVSKDKYFPDDFPVLAKSGCKKVHVYSSSFRINYSESLMREDKYFPVLAKPVHMGL